MKLGFDFFGDDKEDLILVDDCTIAIIPSSRTGSDDWNQVNRRCWFRRDTQAEDLLACL